MYIIVQVLVHEDRRRCYTIVILADTDLVKYNFTGLDGCRLF